MQSQSIKFPTSPGPDYNAFIERVNKIKDDRLVEAIPNSLLVPKLWRGLLGFAVSYALYAGSIVGVAYAPHWLLWIPLWILAGLGGWGLHCIAHDCGHNSFSRFKRLNVVVGHLALLPLVYPFFAWKHAHNLHHLHTNSLEMDTDWRPLSRAVYQRLSPWDRLVYKGTRSWAFWAGTINYWVVSGIRPSFFPKKSMRTQAWLSSAFVATAIVVYLAVLGHFTGWVGILLYFILPWLATHAWFSATTLMHHTTDELPFLASSDWSPNASRLLVTTDYLYPKWLLFLTHNISIHTAHHVLPIVPFYNLPKAQEALKKTYPGMLREKKFRFSILWKIIRSCHFYDDKTGYYISHSASEGGYLADEAPAEPARD